MRLWGRRDEGQALIVVAVSLAMLFAALSFAVDWGYAAAQRRLMVSGAEAGALAAGRMLATSVVVAGGAPLFNRTQEEVYCEALRFVQPNRGPALSSSAYEVAVLYGDQSTPTVWTTSATSSCPPAASTTVPASTRLVRVLSQVSYTSLLGATLGSPTITAAGSARAIVTGAPVVEGGSSWPMVRHFDPADFNGSTCGSPCNPDTVQPVTFWSTSQNNAPNMVYGNFKGQADLSRLSGRANNAVPSLITEWDQSGSTQASPATTPKTDMTNSCGGAWDTAGGENPQQANKNCSIPNWFYYAFAGSFSLSSDWSSPPGGAEAPTPLGSRPAVCPVPSYVAAPSCDDDAIGDWVETAGGNLGSNISALLRQRIQLYGKMTPYSNNTLQNGTRYGKALVVLVYLWDCAETFTSNAPAGQQWSLIPGTGGDCSRVPTTGNTPSVDRVHLFAVAPFTFYEGLVSTSEIRGYWGGGFGDPDSCPTGDCNLNALSNTTFLVPDD